MKIKDLVLTPENVVANSVKGFGAISVSKFTNRDTGDITHYVEILSRGHSTVRVKLMNLSDKTLDNLAEIEKELHRQAKAGKDPVVMVDFEDLQFTAWAVNGNSGVSGSARDVQLKDEIIVDSAYTGSPKKS